MLKRIRKSTQLAREERIQDGPGRSHREPRLQWATMSGGILLMTTGGSCTGSADNRTTERHQADRGTCVEGTALTLGGSCAGSA
jgi:hypothetical protein